MDITKLYFCTNLLIKVEGVHKKCDYAVKQQKTNEILYHVGHLGIKKKITKLGNKKKTHYPYLISKIEKKF